MAGISAFSTYLPRYRLPRAVIAQHWGSHALPGERSVANHDEDSLTLAVAASQNALGVPSRVALDGVFFVSNTAPYREKLVASSLAAVLDTESATRTLDFTDSLRAGSGALFTAFDLVESGQQERVLVATGEVRPVAPDSMDEKAAGDAGAAVVVSRDAGGVELLSRASVTEDFHGTWRTDREDYLRSFPGGLDAKFGYGRIMPQVLHQALEGAGVQAEQISRAVVCGSNPRAIGAVVAKIGIDPMQRLQDSLWGVVGDTGVAQSLLLLAAALEHAQPGELILWGVYGDGADAAVFRVGDQVSAGLPEQRLEQQIEVKRTLDAYGKYARFRKFVKSEFPELESSSAAVLFRDRKEMLPLYGGRCPKCDTLQFPINRICVRCTYEDGLEPIPLPRRGTVFTYYENHVLPNPDPPLIEAVIELDGGARFFCQMTDVAPADLHIGMRVELVFRRYHDAGGIHNYFWKARPAAAAASEERG